MSAGPEPRSVRVRAAGKINLALHVGAAGQDGYHRLASVFQAVSLHEEVVATTTDVPGVSVTVTGRQADRVPTDETNLAVRAARLLAEHVGVEDGVALQLRKGVPVAGGMGGGSADAAAALVACDLLWHTGMSREELTGLAARLGADVPFALLGHTAIGTGRGDLLTPVLSRGQYHWALALRSEGLSTPTVYRTFDELGLAQVQVPEVEPALLHALRAGDPGALGRALRNDLQPAALALDPSLAEPMQVAEQAGALGVVLSGSGPTVAALARSAQHALVLAAALTAAGVADEVMTATGPASGARVIV